MGLVASQARLLMLTDRKSTLEFQMQCITTRLMAAAASTSSLALQQSNWLGVLSGNPSEADKNNANVQLENLEAQLTRINSWNKQLELMQKQIETQHNAVITEIESVQKVIDKNISMSFKYFNQNG